MPSELLARQPPPRREATREPQATRVAAGCTRRSDGMLALSSTRFRDGLTAAQDVASRRAIQSRGCYRSRCRVPCRRGARGDGG